MLDKTVNDNNPSIKASQFKSAYELFRFLLQDETVLLGDKLDGMIDKKDPLYQEARALINAYYKNQQETIISPLIHQQAKQLSDDEIVRTLEGKQIGIYRITQKIGEGGMSCVYLAERNDGELNQKVAIKFIYPSIIHATHDNFLNREAQHLADLDHPNIAKIKTVEKTDNGLPYLVMEYIQGLPLND